MSGFIERLLFRTKRRDPVVEVEEQENVREARTQLRRAQAIFLRDELDRVERVASGKRRANGH